MEIWIIRDTEGPDYTLGRLYVNQKFLGHTCEDKDRHLEKDPEAKVYGKSAIPTGVYEADLSLSSRFKKVMPIIHGVAGFEGIRIHGGNTAADTLGCPLLGAVRSRYGVFNCAEVNERLIHMMEQAKAAGEKITVTVARSSEWSLKS
jgi:hypothetical protein